MKNIESVNSLGKNALLNGIKTICSIIFPFISFAYCSRVLGTDGLGAYSYGQSIIAYLLLIAGLGIPNYAIREGAYKKQNKKEFNMFINQVFTINVITTLITYCILIFLFILFPKINTYKYIILIQSIQIVLTTLGTDWINTIYEDYLYLTIRYIIIQIISLILLVLLVNNSSDIYIYTLITVLANCGGYILNWKYLKDRGIKPTLTKKIELKRHIKPILILFCNSIATVIYLNSDITMLGSYTDDSTVGIYTVSSKIYTMMKTLINAVILITLPRFSSYLASNNTTKYKEDLSRIAEILIVLVSQVIIGLFMEADKILNLVAGKEYVSGSTVVQILSIAIFFAVGACFFSYSILIPNKKEKYFLFSTIAAAIVNISLNIILLPIYGINAAAITTLIAEIIVFSITAFYSIKTIDFNFNVKTIIKIIIGCIAVFILCILLDNIKLSSDIILIIEIGLSALTYFFILLVLKCESVIVITNQIVDKVKKKGIIDD